MTTPKVAVIEEPPADTIARLRQQLQAAQQERDGLREEVEQLTLEVHGVSQRADALHHSYLAVTQERDEALRQATALHQSLVNATAERATAQAEGVRFAARAINAREVAEWLLAEWTDPANWAEAIDAAEAKFGTLDWLRGRQG